MSTDARQRPQATKTRTRGRGKGWYPIAAFASLALSSVALLTMYLWWRTRGPALASSGDGLQPSLVQGAPDADSVTGPPASAEDGGRAPVPPIIELLPSDTTNTAGVSNTQLDTHFDSSSLEYEHSKLPSADGLSILIKDPPDSILTAAHDPGATENTVLVIPGNGAFSIGGTGVNGRVGAALLKQAWRNRVAYTRKDFRELTARIHHEAYKCALTHKRGRLVRVVDEDNNVFFPTRQILTFLHKSEPPWNRDAVGLRAGVLFLDELKLEYALSGNPCNRFLLYVVPPNGKADDVDFYQAYHQTILDALRLIKAYNKKSKGSEVTRVLLPPFWTKRTAQGRALRRIALHCLDTLRIAARQGLTAGLTVELIDDAERSFSSEMVEEGTLLL